MHHSANTARTKSLSHETGRSLALSCHCAASLQTSIHPSRRTMKRCWNLTTHTHSEAGSHMHVHAGTELESQSHELLLLLFFSSFQPALQSLCFHLRRAMWVMLNIHRCVHVAACVCVLECACVCVCRRGCSGEGSNSIHLIRTWL